MKFKILLKAEIKNTLTKIPKLFFSTIILFAVIGIIAFFGTKYLYNDESNFNVTLGLVIEDDTAVMGAITNFITNSKSVAKYASFITCTRAELNDYLDNGKIYAGVILQENAAKDIMNGTNTPIEIVFPKNSGFEASMIAEIAKACASLLDTAQSGIYTSIDFYNTHYKSYAKQDMLDRLNMTYVYMVLKRATTFNEHTITATGDISLVAYYCLAAVIMILLFFAINTATTYTKYNSHLSNRLLQNNIGITKQLFIKYISVVITYVFCLLVLAPILFYFFKIGTSINMLLAIIIGILALSSFTLLLYELFNSNVACILFIFLFNIFIAFASGLFIPLIMLPKPLINIGKLFPAHYIFEILSNLATRDFSIIPYIYLMIFTIFYFTLTCIIKNTVHKRRAA